MILNAKQSPRLKTDLVKILKSSVENKLKNLEIKWKKNKSMTIVLCSKGYPGSYRKNKIIKNIDKIKLQGMITFFMPVQSIIITNFFLMRRVLNFTSLGKNFFLIRKKNIKLINILKWKEGFFRKDIGWKVIN